MPYVLLPNTGQSLGETRDQTRTNFSLLQSAFDENHVSVSSNNGKHKFLQMPVQSAAPTTAASEGGLYVKDDSAGAAQLFYREESNGTERQITGGNVGSSGKIPLAGGVFLIWNIISAPAVGNIPISFPHGGFATNCFNVTLQVVRNDESASFGNNVYVLNGSVTNAGFTLIRGAGTVPVVYYSAIGN